ncbi:DNA translocase FtsK [uncultured Amnibacterium sp.]|uniref:DNA translocase FtsK n=1 Tax=uncultured Amnibacterium sp. TaxID=1631851 RepID=UPI0035CA4D12
MPSALSVVRPAAAAVALLAAVAVTAVVLYAYWPAGVAVGLVLGAGAVVAVGARMELDDRLHPADEDLEARLGIVREPRPAAAPSAEAPAVEAVATLPSQPDVLYFTSDDDPDAAEARVVVAADPGAADPGAADSGAVDPVRADLGTLKAELGEGYRDFARAAQLVVSTQYASAARLQRDLGLPYSRARRLLADLEHQHFVGPATGSLPRQVLMPKERLPEVEALLAEV